MSKRFLIMGLLLAILLTSCAAATQSRDFAASGVTKGIAPAAQPAEQPQLGVAVQESGSFDTTTTPANIERMIVKNASLAIAVDDPSASMDRISRMAEAMGGFVVSANVYQSTLASGAEVPRASITIRVPVEKLNDALAQIKAETKQPVVSETVSSQDVTGDYTDLDSRLRNLEAAEKQLQSILDRATKTQDVLDVFNQLTQVRGQIEVIKGQMKFYSESAALSSVSVELMANAAVQPLTIGGWQPVGVAKQALQALIDTLRVLANIAIWLVILVIPVLAIIVLPPFLVIRYFLRRRARHIAQVKATPPPASE